MNEWIIFLAVLLGALAVFGGYAIGIASSLKDIEIEKLKTERDMYKERLAEWKSED